MPNWFPILASIILALIPVLIWLKLIHKEGEEKGLYVKTFIFGTLAVIPPFVLIFAFDRFPDLNIYSLINSTVEQVALAALLTNVVVGIVEEIAKQSIVRILDRRHPEYIQTISSALKLSICAGLGFAFAENIFYFYNVWVSPQFGAVDLFATFIFRSAFTMLGHMVFSGIFGYYFGIGKFAADITEQARWEGRKMRITRFFAKLFGTMSFSVYREQQNLTGLFIAMTLHALFNASLDLSFKLPSILIVILSAAYIVHLLQTKAGHLLFSVTRRRASTMAARDQDVVMELLGMWTKEGRLDEVVGICDRLLERDPDNNVVKLFKAKAGDSKELRRCYNALKEVFGKGGSAIVATTTAKTTGSPPETTVAQEIKVEDEKVILEVMDMYFKEGKYKQVLDVANRLIERNPDSQGARLLLQKSMDKQKLSRLFDSLSMLFKE